MFKGRWNITAVYYNLIVIFVNDLNVNIYLKNIHSDRAEALVADLP